MKIDLKSKAKMQTIDEISEKLLKASKDHDRELPAMASFAMGMQTMIAIDVYEDKLDELMGSAKLLFEALEQGGFVDSQGTPLTDTITYSNLKRRLGYDAKNKEMGKGETGLPQGDNP